MNITDAPKKQPVPFGINGQRENLLATTPAGDNTASYDAGFPAVTMILKAAGGLPPKGQDMNQILYELSALARWFSAGGGNQFDSAFSTSVSGYPLGATVLATDGSGYWISATNANTNNPENSTSALTGWLPYSQSGVTSLSGLAAANITLTTLQAGKGRINLSGTLTANINIVFPAWEKGWIVVNKCTGAFTVTCKTAAGTGVSVASGATANITGDGTNIILDTNVMNVTTQVTGVIGQASNAKMSVATASATATFTADELIVGTALGGAQYRLGNFSKTINLATTGAGGMDTGTAPVSGYVALYAIYNPTTAASAMLAVNATAAVAQQVYGGAYMPAGYTASALISVVATNASSLILPFSQIARTITIGSLSVFNTTTASASLVTVNIASAVPKNAKSVKVTGNTSTSGSSALFLNIYETSNAMGQNAFATTSTGLTYTTGNINLPVPQTIYANYGPAVTGFNQTLLVSGYTF